MEIRDLADKVGRSYDIDPRKLKVRGDLNVRDLSTSEAQAKLDELMEEIIEAGGVRVPLEVYREGNEIYVTCGHRRLAATLKAIKTRDFVCATVPCMLEPRGRNDIDRIYEQFTLNNSSLPLTVFEIGRNIQRLIVAGESIPQIAKRHTKTVGWVDGILKVMEAPPEAQAMVKAGEIAPTLMNAIIREEGPVEGTATLKRAVAKAKAGGKKKATAKHVSRASPAGTAPRLIDVGGGLFCALIDGHKSASHSLAHWGKLAHDIADRSPSDPSLAEVKTAALVLALDFLDRTLNNQTAWGKGEAKRIMGEINLALGRPADAEPERERIDA